MRDELIRAIADMEEDEALRLAEAWLAQGADPNAVLEAAKEALGVVGQRYEAREYFLPELIIAGDLMKAIAALVKPRLAEAAPARPRGRVLIGTVAGDIHDIGKDIVVFMLEVNNLRWWTSAWTCPPSGSWSACARRGPRWWRCRGSSPSRSTRCATPSPRSATPGSARASR